MVDVKCKRRKEQAAKKRKKKVINAPPLPKNVVNPRTNSIFVFKGLLGKGGFAKVYAVQEKSSKQILACKAVLRASLTKPSNMQKLKYEIKIHREMKHKNVVKYITNFQDKDRIYILMEYCKHQTLMELVNRRKNLSEPETQYYMLQILEGVSYLHNQNVIHRDLKLGNILIDSNMRCKLADFGLATQLLTPEQRKTTICGTPNYIAPEVLNGKKGGHSFECDIWSLGVIMFTLILGKPPFQTGKVETTYKKIKSSTYSYPAHIPISDAARSLIDRMLQQRAGARPQLADVENHRFFLSPAPPTSLPITALRKCPPQYVNKRAPKFEAPKPHPKRKRKLSGEDNFPVPSGGAKRRRTAIHPLLTKISNVLGGQDLQPQAAGGTRARRRKRTDRTGTQGEICVTKWIDYRKKYGIGYRLSTGEVGVWFNDNTRILLHMDKRTVTYIGAKLPRNRSHEEPVERYTTKQYPPSMRKKITLVEHFHYHLQNKDLPATKTPLPVGSEVMVMEASKRDEGIMFVLNNQTIQTNFRDDTEIFLDLRKDRVVYTDARRESWTHPLDDLPRQDNTIKRRLLYVQKLMKATLG